MGGFSVELFRVWCEGRACTAEYLAPARAPGCPANVSAILSAVVLNMGVYGILRVNADLLPPGIVAGSLRWESG